MSYLFLYLYTQASCLGSQGCSLPHKEQCHRCTSTTSRTHHVPRGKFSAWAACPALQTCGECFTQAEIRPCCTPRIVLWSCAGKASRTAVRLTAEQHVLRWWRALVLSPLGISKHLPASPSPSSKVGTTKGLCTPLVAEI